MVLLLGLKFLVKRRLKIFGNICMVFLKPAYTERFKSGISQTKQNINKYEPNLRISFKINMVNIGYISNSGKKGRKNGCTRDLQVISRNLLPSILKLRDTSVMTVNMIVL